ncbi:MAG: DNA polymerase I [Lachnospiraceae bacterium]|nr:DNA polymerase I [Lachnospiraceae bacterium]
MNEKLVLIDGHSILNRAFYGVPDLSNSQGLHTNAVYGFLNIMFKIMEEEKPDFMAVAFDVKAPTFRHEIFKEYKGTRKPMPEELRQQVPVMKEVLQAMGIRTMELPGYEADDILGTLAKRAQNCGMEVALVSGDRDLLQIATDRIKIRIPKTKGARTEVEDYYASDVVEKYGVDPIAFIDLKALMGDTADNIPGVPKVGEKTASELMKQFGSLDEIYAHVQEITKKSIRESLIANEELAYLSKTLATINVESPVELDWQDAKVKNLFTKEAYTIFQKLEFKNLLGKFDNAEMEQKDGEKKIVVTSDFSEASAVFEKAAEAGEGAYFVMSDGAAHNLCGLALCLGEEEIYVLKAEGFLTARYLCGQLAELYRKGTKLSTFHVKKTWEALLEDESPKDASDKGATRGSCGAEGVFDVLIAAYLLNPLKNDYAIEDISQEHCGKAMQGRKELFEKLSWESAMEQKSESFVSYAGNAAYVCWKAQAVLTEKLKEQGMWQLFCEIEMPLTRVLYEMEKEGVIVQREELKAYGDALVDRIEELEKSIHEAAGCDFNINSPKQLGEILFEKMGLQGGKKTKTGYSTAADILEKLAPENPIIADILEYRGLTKLKSTYADGLADYIGEDGRIHTSFNQTITATGRISSTEPNLQNIPMRTELGRLIRKVFVPKEGCVFTDADYSQIELRVLAHISGDAELIDAYKSDADIHRITASKVFHTPFEEVTDLQRRNAKAVNFGIVYGISSFGLSQDLSITRKEAEGYINQYFATYPDVKAFLDRQVEEAKEKGYVTTMFGRRRPIPELKSSNFMQRSFGERVAMNSPIQGTAADIIKIAMIHVWEELNRRGLKSKLILQIHDELLIETDKTEVEEVKQLLAQEMRNAANLAVCLEVDLHTGDNWYDAK